MISITLFYAERFYYLLNVFLNIKRKLKRFLLYTEYFLLYAERFLLLYVERFLLLYAVRFILLFAKRFR